MTDKKPEPKLPAIRAPQLKLLESLCNSCAVSGDEHEVRKIVLEQIKPHVDHFEVDALGNVLAVRKQKNKAAQPGLRVMIAAHMDEVGLMVTDEDSDGIYRFSLVGGIDARQLVGKPVWVGREHTTGVIGAKPIHLTSASERQNTIKVENLRIDVSPSKKVKVGERAVFATSFQRLGPSLRAKALDDRIGVASLIYLIQNPPPGVEIMAAFTVQEEVGLRGARVAAYHFNPDLALALDCTPAYDLPVWDEEENTAYNTRLGKGPALYIADAATLSDPRLIRHFSETAEKLRIPYQFRQAGGGGTDAGAIHKQRAGIPSLSISVPARYLHTASGICRIRDWEYTHQLVFAALSRLTPAVFEQER